jgi:hypothetical protein
MSQTLIDTTRELFKDLLEADIEHFEKLLGEELQSKVDTSELLEMFKFGTALALHEEDTLATLKIARRGLAVARILGEDTALFQAVLDREQEAAEKTKARAPQTAPKIDSQQIQKLSGEMIEHFARENNLSLYSSDSGLYLVRLGFNEETGRTLDIYMTIESEEQIFVIRVIQNQMFPCEKFEAAVWACNEYNMTRRWPKAYLHVKSHEKAKYATIDLEMQLPAHKGISQAFLGEFIMVSISGAISFWEWASEEKGF